MEGKCGNIWDKSMRKYETDALATLCRETRGRREGLRPGHLAKKLYIAREDLEVLKTVRVFLGSREPSFLRF